MRLNRVPLPIVLGAVIALLGISVGAAVAAIPGTDGTIHGCYANRNGALRVIDPAVSACSKSETAMSWNQAGQQGDPGPALESLNGVPCTTDSGPGVTEVRNENYQTDGGGFGSSAYAMNMFCVPDGAYVALHITGHGTLSVSPAAAHGGSVCPGVVLFPSDNVDCTLFYPDGTTLTVTATPDSGYVLQTLFGPNCADTTCTFTLSGHANVTALFPAAP